MLLIFFVNWILRFEIDRFLKRYAGVGQLSESNLAFGHSVVSLGELIVDSKSGPAVVHGRFEFINYEVSNGTIRIKRWLIRLSF